MPQKTEEIRRALATIPSIYTTLTIIDLLPEPTCGCKHERPEVSVKALAKGDTSQAKMDTLDATRTYKRLWKHFNRKSTAGSLAQANQSYEKALIYLRDYIHFCAHRTVICGDSSTPMR